ncbi:MAG TPA: hypothetical protein VEB00_05595 [Clostridia bacterium]|nr:hypothetical protein [Clostridia bacterium]
MKKTLSIILITCLVLTMGVFASAHENTDTSNSDSIKEVITPEEKAFNEKIDQYFDNHDKESIEKTLKKLFSAKISEIEMLETLKNMTDAELSKQGYSKNDIKKLRSLDYAEKLKERAKYSEETLKSMGYSDEKIEMLKNFDGSQEQVTALSATLSIDGFTGMYSYSSSTNQTKHSGIVSWEWDYAPVWAFTDIIGASWFEGWHLSSTAYHNVYYEHSLGTRATQTSKKSFSAVETIAAKSTFPVTGTVYGDLDYMWARSGYVNLIIYIAGNELNSNIMIKYGHRQVVGTPSISVVGGLDFNFNTGTSEAGSYLIQYPDEG